MSHHSISTVRISMAALLVAMLQQLAVSQQQMTVDTILVTSTGLPQTLSQTGKSVTVLTAEDLAQIPANSIDDLLKYIPGIEVQARSAFGAQGDISMRGSTFTQVLVLLDGMRINDPLTAHFNSNLPVTMEEISRIEVLRGPAAALYGADAVGGVINIITKGFATQRNESGQTISGSYHLGEHRLRMGSLGFSKQTEKLYVGAGIASSKSDGQLIGGKSITGTDGNTTELTPYRNYFDIQTVGLTLGYRPNNKWNIAMRSAHDQRDFDARYYYTVSTFDKSNEQVNNWWHQASISHLGNKSVSSLQIAHKHTTDRFEFSPDFPSTNLHTTKLTNLQATHRINLSRQIDLMGGIQTLWKSISSTDRGIHDDLSYGLFLTALLQPTEAFSITPSLRMDHDNVFGTEFTPQLNASYLMGPWTFRTSVGRAIRAPDYTERFVSFNLTDLTSGRNLGNPNLQAERSWSQEIGVDWTPHPAALVAFTFFRRQSKNLIDYSLTSYAEIPRKDNLLSDASYFYATNLAEVASSGFELQGMLTKNLGDSRLQGRLGYTYLNTSSDEEIISVYTSNHARHLLSFEASLRHPVFHIALSGLYKDRPEREATGIASTLTQRYSIVNAEIGIFLISNQLSLTLNSQNIFNTPYQDILGAIIPGRWSRIGVKFRF